MPAAGFTNISLDKKTYAIWKEYLCKLQERNLFRREDGMPAFLKAAVNEYVKNREIFLPKKQNINISVTFDNVRDIPQDCQMEKAT